MPELPPSAYPALFEHTRDGVLVLDPTLRVVAVNRAAEALLGPATCGWGSRCGPCCRAGRPPRSPLRAALPMSRSVTWARCTRCACWPCRRTGAGCCCSGAWTPPRRPSPSSGSRRSSSRRWCATARWPSSPSAAPSR
ncbi:PAS domain-containing protein [Corallococcus sp. 4LFB]|uniref:PAS domain-containing protein n=1 Tax=Corallococcus sp. 4LFB TaxID=3383249 RepID=UPI003974C847